MKELLGCQQTSSDPPLLHLANQVCDGNLLELSQRINNFFKSVSDHLPALSADNDYLQLEIPCVPSKYVIPVEKVEKQLRKLDTSKAPGPDSIPSWVLKEFSELLAGPVAAIYNSSLREGHVPRIWRAAYISPLPKKKPPEQIETDLRPISLTAVLCKQMEEFVVKWVWDIVQDRVDQTNTAP